MGRNVTKFKPGDAVYGDVSECGFGGFAEYVCVPENALASKPESMTFVEAAAIPHAAMLAVQGLIDQGQIQPGQKVLINGAGGGKNRRYCLTLQRSGWGSDRFGLSIRFEYTADLKR